MSLLYAFAALMQIAASPPAAMEVEAVPTRDPATWVSASDYPSDARKKGEQGAVTFRLTVGTQGQPTGCSIIESSGSASLDARTCSVLLRRAHFIPPTNANGIPAVGTYQKTFHWALASIQANPGPSLSYTLKIDVDKMGRVESCEIIDAQKSILEGQTSRAIDPCPPKGSPFTRDFVVRNSPAKRSFVVTESIAELSH